MEFFSTIISLLITIAVSLGYGLEFIVSFITFIPEMLLKILYHLPPVFNYGLQGLLGFVLLFMACKIVQLISFKG